MAHTRDADADDLVIMQAAEPTPPGEAIPSWPPTAETLALMLPPLEDPPEGIADLATIAANLGLSLDEAAQRLNANPLVDLRDARDVLEAAVATEIASYGLQALTAGAIRAIARAAVSRQLELVDDVLNRPEIDVRTRLTGDETGWL